MRKFFKFLANINELIMFKHSIFSLPFIFIAMIISSKEIYGTSWFGWKLFFLGIIAAISARNFAMAFNRYVDGDIDKENPRTVNRPSVDGRITKKNILFFTALNGIIFTIVAYAINILAFYLSFPILITLAAYSLFKRFSSLAHLVLGVCLGFAPIAGVIGVSQGVTLWSILLAFGVAFWVAGFDILYSLQDINYDKRKGLFSIPAKYGKDATFFISRLFHFLATLFWLLFIIAAKLGFWSYLGLFFSGVILFYEHKIVIRDFKKIDSAFFTLNGYLGIMFFIMIFIDRF